MPSLENVPVELPNGSKGTAERLFVSEIDGELFPTANMVMVTVEKETREVNGATLKILEEPE